MGIILKNSSDILSPSIISFISFLNASKIDNNEDITIIITLSLSYHDL